MLLQFFVLGFIPGTHLQITYMWLLVMLDIVCSAALGLVIYDYTFIKPMYEQHSQQQVTPKIKSRKTIKAR